MQLYGLHTCAACYGASGLGEMTSHHTKDNRNVAAYPHLDNEVNSEPEQMLCVSTVRGARCWWRSWLRHCATSRKVAGSIPDVVTGIFH
jgi:hypothetical protein